MNWLKIAQALPELFAVLKKGKELNNAAAWKNAQLISTALMAVVVALRAFGFDLGLTDENALYIAEAIVMAINAFLILATSVKVGFGKKEPPTNLPPIDLIAHSEPERVQPPALPPNSQTQPGPDEEHRGDGWGDY